MTGGTHHRGSTESMGKGSVALLLRARDRARVARARAGVVRV